MIFSRFFWARIQYFYDMRLKGFIVRILKHIKKKICNFFFKIPAIYDDCWSTSELKDPRGWKHNCSNSCPKNNFVFLFIMNKSNKIRIRFQKYWMLINSCKFKAGVRIFTKKWSKTGHKSANFYYIKNPYVFY